MSKEQMWAFDVKYITIITIFKPLLCDLCQTSTERFMKPAVLHDFCGMKMSLPLALHY